MSRFPYRSQTLAWLALCSVIFNKAAATRPTTVTPVTTSTARESWQMITPENSTVSLYCDSLFEYTHVSTAVWYKNGVRIGAVTSERNLILRSPYQTNQTEDDGDSVDDIPDVGFLVFERVQIEHEGTYWCETSVPERRHSVRNQPTELRVAWIGWHFHSSPGWHIAKTGDIVRMQCKAPDGYPKPHITWILDNKVVRNNSDYTVLPDGGLLIHHFRPHLSGRYTCMARNIAGTRTVHSMMFHNKVADMEMHQGYMADSPNLNNVFDSSPTNQLTASYLSSQSVLWFVSGMLLCAFAVLLYIVIVYCWLRPQSRRHQHTILPTTRRTLRTLENTGMPIEQQLQQQQQQQAVFVKRTRSVHPRDVLP